MEPIYRHAIGLILFVPCILKILLTKKPIETIPEWQIYIILVCLIFGFGLICSSLVDYLFIFLQFEP